MSELPNINLSGTLSQKAFKSRRINVTHNYPERESAELHGARIIQEYFTAKAKQNYSPAQVAAIKTKTGLYVDVSSLKGREFPIDKLEVTRSGIRICNVKTSGEKNDKEIVTTLFIPNAKEHVFLRKLEDYSKGVQEGKKNPANNDLVRSIEHINSAVMKSFWTDREELYPADFYAWCEIWLRVDHEDAEKIRATFIQICKDNGIATKDDFLTFPDRVVCVALISEKEINTIFQICDSLAEIRRVAEVDSFFTDIEPTEQKKWVDDLLSRVVLEPNNVALCILDTGVVNEHPLLSPLFPENSVHKARPYMSSTTDTNGHGTQMAGVAGYFDLGQSLGTQETIRIHHSLESVKLLGSQINEPELYGDYTKQAISTVEIAAPDKSRIVCLAVTAESTAVNDDGRASSWSAALDAISYGDDTTKRLILVSAGNVVIAEIEAAKYPNSCILHRVEDPAQSWNAITVGAYTEKISIESPYHQGYSPIASVGALSPFSATSRMWGAKWPIKPEILCEGGNAAINDQGSVDTCDSLCVLTTHHRPFERLFSTTNATSSAVAKASWMAAEIASKYPEYWPETIRALLVLSASWSNQMMRAFCPDTKIKRDVQTLLRTCGYGIADFDKAIHCSENAVNMIIQGELQPFEQRGGYCGFGQMHLHELPWPTDYLLNLREVSVKLKVVLSYFIEPGPGENGFNDKYRYPSCGLRFDVNTAGESREKFERRINVKMLEDQDNEDLETSKNDTRRWIIGEKGRSTGSLHCDIWMSTGAELCESNYIAVYPTSGWWRTRQHLKRCDSKIRYSLVVSLSTPKIDVQLYTQIMNIISIPVSIQVDPGNKRG